MRGSKRLAVIVLLLAPACAHRAAAPTTPPKLVKELLLETPGLRTVTGFAWLEGEEPRLLVSGQLGAQGWSLDGGRSESVEFPMDCKCLSTPWHTEPIDVDGDGDFEFVNRGGNWHRTSVFASTGELLWGHGSGDDSAPNSMAAGDLEGDGRMDFVVGMNGDGGVRRLDSDGNPVWQLPDGNVWQLEVLDVDADGRLEIVHTNADGVFVLRDRSGAVLHTFSTTHYATQFGVLSGPRIIQHTGDRYTILDARGQVVEELPAAVGGRFGDMQVLELGMAGLHKPASVVLESRRVDDLSVLHVFSADGTLLHEELLAEACDGIGALPRGDAGHDLLLGCDERVWRYRVAAAGEPTTPTLSAAALIQPGDAYGPLRFGESEEESARRVQLFPGAICLDAPKCRRVEFRRDGESLVMLLDFEDDRLSSLIAMAKPYRPDGEENLNRSWKRLVAHAEREFGPASTAQAELPPLAEIVDTLTTHTWETESREAHLGIRPFERDDGEVFHVALLLVAPVTAEAAEPAPAAQAP